MRSLILRAVPLAVVLAVLATTVPGAAFHVPDVPVLDRLTFETEHYVAWRVYAPEGALVGVDMRGEPGNTTFASFGLWYVHPETFRLTSMLNPAWYGEAGQEVQVHTLEPAGTLAAEGATDVDVGPMGLQVDFEPSESREWLIVAVVGFDGRLAVDLQLSGTDGVHLLDRTTGPAFLHTESDFRGPVNAVARTEAPAREATVEAKAALGAAVPETAEGRMFAAFRGGATAPTLSMGYDGPGGSRDGDTVYAVTGESSGDYRFRIDRNVDARDNTPVCRGVMGSTCWRTPIWVVGADVHVPQSTATAP